MKELVLLIFFHSQMLLFFTEYFYPVLVSSLNLTLQIGGVPSDWLTYIVCRLSRKHADESWQLPSCQKATYATTFEKAK